MGDIVTKKIKRDENIQIIQDTNLFPTIMTYREKYFLKEINFVKKIPGETNKKKVHINKPLDTSVQPRLDHFFQKK